MNNDNEKIKFKEFYTTSFSGIIDKTYKTRYAEYLSLENDVTTYKFSSYESTKCKGDFSDSANNGEMVFKESESFLITLVNQDGTSCKYQIKKRF